MTTKGKIAELLPDVKEPYQLHDVLRAIGNSRERHGFTIDAQGDKLVMFWSTKDPENPDHSTLLRERWNLALSYDNQDQPTKDFIGKLIGITD